MEIDNELSNVFRKICPDNYVLTIDAENTSKLIDTLMGHVVGKPVFDWVNWWCFDAEFGTREMTYTMDDTQHNVRNESFAEFVNNILWFYNKP